MEKLMRLNGPDGNGIYGKLRQGGNRRLVVHIHGLANHMDDYLGIMSSEFFLERSYDHYRMSLYSEQEGSRQLNNSSPSTHVKDVKVILDHFSAQYDNLYLTAHSLGGLVALLLNPSSVKAMSFWDPALDITSVWASGPFLKPMPERREYQIRFGVVYVIGEAMVEEMKNYPDEKCQELAREVRAPTQFVIPEESIFLLSPRTSPEKYRDAFTVPFDLRTIPGANHLFSTEGARRPLFEATLQWFEKYK